MKKLSNIDLICIDCINTNRAVRALMNSSRNLKFNSIKLLTDKTANYPEIETVRIPYLCSKQEYSDFVLKDLYQYTDSDFVILVQWDGWIVNHRAWTDEFLDYDYGGAPWIWDGVVGNGGFSLRSKKLLKTTKEFSFEQTLNEDHMICRTYRKEFEKAGIKYMPNDLAKKFSTEYEFYNGQFGFHSTMRLGEINNWIKLQK